MEKLKIIPDISDNDTKKDEIERNIPEHNKYISTNEFNNFSGTIFDERLKNAKISNKQLS